MTKLSHDECKTTIEQIKADLEKTNKERKRWLQLSSLVVIATLFLIYEWSEIVKLNSPTLWGFIISGMLILSINWWYWTMSFVRKSLIQQISMFEILKCIVDDVKEVKSNVSELIPKKDLTDDQK